jgi:hypothetical protein
MSIINNQNYNSPENCDPLYTDNYTYSNNLTKESNIIKAKIQLDENGYYIIYKTPYGFRQIMEISCLFIFIIFGILFSVYLINFNDSNLRYLSLFLPLFFFLVGFCCNSIHYILLDPSQKRIILKIEKMFDFISRSQIIQIKDIQKVILKKYGNDLEEESFKIYFLLTNEEKITAIDTCDEKGEGTRALQNLKYFLPEENNFGEFSTY